MKRDYKRWASGLIKGKVLFDAPMRRFTSMKVGGPADCLFFPKDADELRKVIRFARRKKIPFLILGKGTNLIVRDKGVRGWIINLTQGMRKIKIAGAVVEAEAGLPLQRLVQFSIQKGLTGLEPFFGIPGTVGGGLAMNAGAWGAELKDVLLSMTLMKEDGEIVKRFRSRLRFSYRGLVLSPPWIILKGRFQLKRGRKEEILERVKSLFGTEKEKATFRLPQCGVDFQKSQRRSSGKMDRRNRAERISDRPGNDFRAPC